MQLDMNRPITKEFFSVPSFWGPALLVSIFVALMSVIEVSSLLLGSLVIVTSFGFVIFSAYSVFKIDALSDYSIRNISLFASSLLFASFFLLGVNILSEFPLVSNGILGALFYAFLLIVSLIGLVLLEGCLTFALIALFTKSTNAFHISSEAVLAANIHQKYFGLLGSIK